MAGLYIKIPVEFWLAPVPTLADLPTTDAVGSARLVLASGSVYWWNGTAWAVISASVGVITTDSLTANSGTAAAAGKIGEIITSSVAVATTTGVAATGVYGNVTSITLTTGDWQLTGVAGFQENGATLTTSLSAGLSTTTDGSSLGALDTGIFNALISSTSDLIATVPTLNVILAAPTTYYLNTRFFYTSGTPKHYGKLEARRMR